MIPRKYRAQVERCQTKWRQLLLQEEAFQEEEAFQATPPNGEGSA
jgi:hypothetical protein